MIIKLKKLKCEKCGHKWVPRKKEVRICPHCKSAYWDRKNIMEKEVENENNNSKI